ncbi:MAG: D-alanyl-D-alanine carboxypeptidase [Proteobacteria bacterium]|nr:D-alanyl-D-alanine carboxypeptidase [Pseudomonadota bacterium]
MSATRLFLSFCFSLFALAAVAQGEKVAPFETGARQALLYDHAARAVLFAREADARINPASLTKLMTAALVFREMKEGRLKGEDTMVTSAEAWRRGGAVSGNPNMLLTPNKVTSVQELLSGLLVAGANDAALTLAEGIAGKEDRFVDRMNAQAAALKMQGTQFRNATGLAAEGQASTLADLVKLAEYLIDQFPEYYPLFAQREIGIGRGKQLNRNPLLTMEIGADGLMTGASPESGQALVGSTMQDGRRLIVALAGLETAVERAQEARKLIDYGYRRFESRLLFSAGEAVGRVSVYGGAAGSVAAVAPGEIRLPMPRGTNEGVQLRMSYRGPLLAPVDKGTEIARLEVLVDKRVVLSRPLVAGEGVSKGGLVGRARDAGVELFRQASRHGWQWLVDKAGQRLYGAKS